MLQHFVLTAGRGSSIGHGLKFLKVSVQVAWFGLCRLSFLLHMEYEFSADPIFCEVSLPSCFKVVTLSLCCWQDWLEAFYLPA